MAYRRMARRARTTRSRAGRDFFWAAPVQRVGRGGSDFGPFSVARPGFTKVEAQDSSLKVGSRINFSNDLSRLYGAHGATTFQVEDSREARLRDRPWRIEYFEGSIFMGATQSLTGSDNAIAGAILMGSSVAIPRQEGANVPSGILLSEARRVHTEYFVYGRGAATLPMQRSYRKLRIGLTLDPAQDFLINGEIDHLEGTAVDADKWQMLVYGRFRCSRT